MFVWRSRRSPRPKRESLACSSRNRRTEAEAGHLVETGPGAGRRVERIAGREQVTGVGTDPDPGVAVGQVDQRPDLAERRGDGARRAGHELDQDPGRLGVIGDLDQRPGGPLPGYLRLGGRSARAGVDDHALGAEPVGQPDRGPGEVHRPAPEALVGRGHVHQVGRVEEQRAEALAPPRPAELVGDAVGDVRRGPRPGARPPDLGGVDPEGPRRGDGAEQPAPGRDVRADARPASRGHAPVTRRTERRS